MQRVNGYNITGNHGATVREYHVCNAAGAVLQRVMGGLQLAIDHAESLPPGDVPEPPTPEPPKAAKPKGATTKAAKGTVAKPDK